MTLTKLVVKTEYDLDLERRNAIRKLKKEGRLIDGSFSEDYDRETSS